MIRRAFLFALIVVMPFGGMRVMCVEAPLAAAPAGSHAHDSDCERLCPLPEPAARTGGESDCSMSVDNSLIVMAAAVATSPVEEAAPVTAAAQHDFTDHPSFYAAPGLPRTTPPPKA